MQVAEALEQLEAIHEQLTKGEVYAGFPIVGAALVGVLGLSAAALQGLIADSIHPEGFVLYWVVVAAVGAILGGGGALVAFLCHEGDFERRRTLRVLAQFLPALMAGGVTTAVVVQRLPDAIAWLPGLWAIFFGLGLVSAGAYLPRGISTIGRAYLLVGFTLLALSPLPLDQLGWIVGGTFGLGHLAAAWALYRHRREVTHG